MSRSIPPLNTAEKRIFNGVIGACGFGTVALAACAAIFQGPALVEGNRAYWQQTTQDREVLENYAPQIKNGQPLTDEQGVNLIYGEHDRDKNKFISIGEAFDVNGRAERYKGRTYKGWHESGVNLSKALGEIDKRQSKEH